MNTWSTRTAAWRRPPSTTSHEQPAPNHRLSLLSLIAMSELTFSQSERRNFLVPVLIALVIVGGVFAYVYLRPQRIADVTITHTAFLPTHTVFESPSKIVGHQDEI